MTGHGRSSTDNEPVRVAYANDQAEAELLQGACSSPHPTCRSRETSCARLARVSPSHRRGPAPTGPRGCSPGC